MIVFLRQFLEAFVFPTQEVAQCYPDSFFLILPFPAEGIQESLIFIRVKPLRVIVWRYLEDQFLKGLPLKHSYFSSFMIFISMSLRRSCSISAFRTSGSGNCNLYCDANILLLIPPSAYSTTVFFLSVQRINPTGSFSPGSFSLSLR